ncbi:hypothetical protein EVAR_100178_1 [Eumeta japonica]|uniref:Uncharacterized protein n=1 Tax=Eumeta variegata TaxID=151549 RepID=A0A4C2A5R8_EUMVA|nr:hypothetical protein EVAR_100178_1 [Eumeta japonica]
MKNLQSIFLLCRYQRILFYGESMIWQATPNKNTSTRTRFALQMDESTDVAGLAILLVITGSKGGIAVYSQMTLCRLQDVPPLYNTEVPVCRVAVSRHGTLIIVSVYLPPSKRLPENIKTLLSHLGRCRHPFGDLLTKMQASGVMLRTPMTCTRHFIDDYELAIITALTPIVSHQTEIPDRKF